MRFSICGLEIDSAEEAIEQGWTPYFWDGGKHLEPVCPTCSEALPQVGKDGEMEVKFSLSEISASIYLGM